MQRLVCAMKFKSFTGHILHKLSRQGPFKNKVFRYSQWNTLTVTISYFVYLINCRAFVVVIFWLTIEEPDFLLDMSW